MPTDDVKNLILACLAVWNAGLTLVVWLRKPGEDAGHAVNALRDALNSDMAQVTNRLIALETEIEHMPTSEELAKLDGSVRQINERTAAQSEQIRAVVNTVTRIENYLLNQK